MSNKYIGTKDGLIGPVMKGKPLIHPQDCEPESKPYIDSYNAWEAYSQHLAALSANPIPCEGWTPEEGAELVEGVDFRIENSSPCGDDDCYEEKCCKPVAVPITPAAHNNLLTDTRLPTIAAGTGGDYEFNPTAPQEGAQDVETYLLIDDIQEDRVEIASEQDAIDYVRQNYTEGNSMHPDFSEFEIYKKVGSVYVEESEGVATGIKCEIAQPAPGYPAEFVEWAMFNPSVHIHYKKDHKWYDYDDVDMSLPELFTEWKRINSQSK